MRNTTFSSSPRLRAVLLCTALCLLAACAAQPPRQALAQDANVAGKPLKFAGTYMPSERTITLTVNDEPSMRGTLPPYTPTLNMNGEYRGTALRAECYMASALSEKRGLVGIIASSVQSANGKTADTCKMLAGDKLVATLNF